MTARKAFCSGSRAEDLLLTSAIVDDPNDGPTVLHVGLPIKTAGITVLDNWRTMSVRGSVPNDIMLDCVLIPTSAIPARRPKGAWTDIWCGGRRCWPAGQLAYLGVAEAPRLGPAEE